MGQKDKTGGKRLNGVIDLSFEGNRLNLWDLIWPINNTLTIGGVLEALLMGAKLLADGSEVDIE